MSSETGSESARQQPEVTDPKQGEATAPKLLESMEPRDPQAIRALAHPVRMALIELLVHTGTLTATQASEALGESPANCAFHLRTLAKYGFVEEAGGGKGRERPWRRTHQTLHFETSAPDNAEYAAATRAFEDMWLGWLLQRAQAAFAAGDSWPAEWKQARLGQQQMITYLTPAEADQLIDDLQELAGRYLDRLDHPERRPAGAMPVEIVTLSYLLLNLAQVPTQPSASDRTDREER
jgi:DNA-binding transcriptional ArsR family regulator